MYQVYVSNTSGYPLELHIRPYGEVLITFAGDVVRTSYFGALRTLVKIGKLEKKEMFLYMLRSPSQISDEFQDFCIDLD